MIFGFFITPIPGIAQLRRIGIFRITRSSRLVECVDSIIEVILAGELGGRGVERMGKIEAPRIIRALSGASLAAVVAAGCATPRMPEAVDLATTSPIIQASASVEADGPAISPPDPTLSGSHEEAFYVNLALDRNPSVLAARRDVAAIRETIPQVTSLEDPMLTDTFRPIAGHNPQTASGRMPNSLTLSQDVPWPTKLNVRGEVAEQEAKMAMQRLAAEELTVAEQVRLAYYDLYFYQQAVEITRENEAVLETLAGLAEIRYRTGGSQQDVLGVQIEQDRLRDQLIEYETRLKQTQADLAALMHCSPEAEPLVAKTLDLPPVPETLDPLVELAARCRPELRERLHAISRDQRERELARLEYYPDMTVGTGWHLITESDAISPMANGKDNFGFTLGVSLPIYRDRLRAGVREAEHRVVESARRYDAALDETFRKIRRLVLAADAAKRQLALYRDRIVPRTEQALEVSIADYPAGRTDIQQVINNYTELLAFRIQIAGFERDLGQALASLDRVVGCEIAAAPLPATNPQVPPAPAAEVAGDEGSGETGETGDRESGT